MVLNRTHLFKENSDLEDVRRAVIQGFEQLILDAIYNEGKIQDLYKGMNKKVRKFFNSFDNIFTLNYDNNIEKLVGKPVYHLHGDFSVLANSENNDNVQGYIRQKRGELVVLPSMKHCFCNALLNYSGKLKYKTAEKQHLLIMDAESYNSRYLYDKKFKSDVGRLQDENPAYYELIMTKNSNHTPTDAKSFLQGNASVSYIALQEGILPSVLFLICAMRYEKYIQL